MYLAGFVLMSVALVALTTFTTLAMARRLAEAAQEPLDDITFAPWWFGLYLAVAVVALGLWAAR